MKQLKHPQIPAYLDYHVAESASDVQFMLIQEYIEGNSLQQLVEKGWRGTETEILAIFWQAADILEYLHTLSPPVIHRDISPKNLLLSPTNTVYLVDFGAVQDRVRTTLRGGTTIVGTFGYMPFEQFQGQTVPASDYYALGATLLYLLTHRHPEDFPKDDLVIRFQPYLHASAPMTRLLEGLLEPAAENRLHSPEQLHAIFTEQAGKLSKRALKPPNTKITRKVHRGNRLTFRLPLRESFKALALWGLGVFFLMASIRATYELLIEVIESGTLGILLAFPLIMLPFGIIGAKLFLSNTYRAFGKPVLELSPEGIAITVACFGRRRPKKAERMPIAELRESDITVRMEGKNPAIVIQHAKRTLSIGAANVKLSQAEAEWLRSEILDYVSTMTGRTSL